MGSCHLRCRDDLLGVHFAQAGDIVCHAAREEFHVLGKIADVLAELVLVPGLNVDTIESDCAA